MTTENLNDTQGIRPYVELQTFEIAPATAISTLYSGTVVDFALQNFVLQVTEGQTAGPERLAGGCTVLIDFSIDGTNWSDTLTLTRAANDNVGTKDTDTNANRYFRYARARLTANSLSGADRVALYMVHQVGATDAQAALDLAAHLADSTAAHVATAIGFTPTTSADWESVPTQAGGALDTLGARGAVLLGAEAPGAEVGRAGDVHICSGDNILRLKRNSTEWVPVGGGLTYTDTGTTTNIGGGSGIFDFLNTTGDAGTGSMQVVGGGAYEATLGDVPGFGHGNKVKVSGDGTEVTGALHAAGLVLNEPAFTPTTGADWDGPPANLQAALDELAARIRVLEP